MTRASPASFPPFSSLLCSASPHSSFAVNSYRFLRSRLFPPFVLPHFHLSNPSIHPSRILFRLNICFVSSHLFLALLIFFHVFHFTFSKLLSTYSLACSHCHIQSHAHKIHTTKSAAKCSSFPKQFTVGFSLRKKSWPRYALAASPELVRLVSAMGPPCVRPCVHFGCASKPCLPCVRLAFCPPPCVR